MRIHYFSSEPWEKEYVQGKLPPPSGSGHAGYDIVFHTAPLSELPDLKDDTADVICTFIDSHFGEEEFARFPALKLMATR